MRHGNLGVRRWELCVLACLPAVALLPWLLAAAEEPTGPDPQRWAGEMAAFADWDRRNAWPADSVLFVGSSSIRMWATREAFPDLPVINRGFGGSHLSEAVHYIEETVLRYRPRVVVLYSGDNDVQDGKSPETVAADFRAFVRRVHAELPRTTIVCLSIKPSASRWEAWPRMRAANELLRAVARETERVEFVDVARPMLGNDGQPRAELYLDDRLHLSAAGYEGWARQLGPLLKRLHGENE